MLYTETRWSNLMGKCKESTDELKKNKLEKQQIHNTQECIAYIVSVMCNYRT